MLKPTLLIVFVAATTSYAEQKTEQQIAEAVAALPVALRQDATIVFDRSPGERIVLRQGTNGIICEADSPEPGFVVNCYYEKLEPFIRRFRTLRSELKDNDKAWAMAGKEVEEGKLSISNGSTRYILSGARYVSALHLTVIHLPSATQESTGISEAQDNRGMWLMYPGTPVAHIMLHGK